MVSYMTDYQYQSILRSIKMILSGCKTIDEAQDKLDELLTVEKPKSTTKKKGVKKSASKKK